MNLILKNPALAIHLHLTSLNFTQGELGTSRHLAPEAAVTRPVTTQTTYSIAGTNNLIRPSNN